MKLYLFQEKSVMGLVNLRHNHMLKECLRVVNIRSDLLNADIKIEGSNKNRVMPFMCWQKNAVVNSELIGQIFLVYFLEIPGPL